MRSIFSASVALAIGVGLLAACDEDIDVNPRPPVRDGGTASDATTPTDAAPTDATVTVDGGVLDATPGDAPAPQDAAGDSAPSDASEAGATDAAAPQRLLLTGIDFVGGSSELVALNLATKQVDGRLTAQSTDSVSVEANGQIFFLQRDKDVVTRLDPREPWKPLATWNVKMSDAFDGGRANANPSAVLVAAGPKAYVLRYNRNAIAVLDTAHAGDGGAPIASIDLSALLQPGDQDGTIEMTDGVYVASRRLVYVVLQNVNQASIVPPDYKLRCAGTKSTVIGIDVDTDTVVDLNGNGPGLALELSGVNPTGVAYDAAHDRLLLAHGGCYERVLADGGATDDAGDAGAGPAFVDVVRGRMVEELSLFTNQTRMLLDTTTHGYPSRFVFIDDRRAILRFFNDATFASTTYVWDPTQPALARPLASPDSFVYDGAGRLIGLEKQFNHDGGLDSIDAVAVRIADGRVSKIATVPFTTRDPYVQSSQLWPPP